MNEYHKINTIFKRDPSGKTLLLGEYSQEEFEYLASNKWVFTEKVDGTNIRVMWDGARVSFGGKTDRAMLPAKLLTKLEERFLAKKFDKFPPQTCLYGEGFGAGIQKGGGNYGEAQDFVLFDVKIGHLWQARENVEGIARELEVPIVPIIGTGNLSEMIEWARRGITSAWGNFAAEGIVARPSVELRTRDGKRIITKIKSRDFANMERFS